MKKSYLMIAAAVLTFAACSNNEVLVDKEASKTSFVDQQLIGFTTFTQKATRAENSGQSYSLLLENHHNAFKVWGYKNTSADAVFNAEQVSHQDADANATPAKAEGWIYTNNRYWDKAATDYYFYAYAPYSSTVFTFKGVESNATQPDGYFTIESAYTKVGENVSTFTKSTADPKVASETKVESWTAANATDVDLMIADVCHLSGTNLTNAYTNPVQLNFIHILSRLNITVKTASDKGFYPGTATGDKIIVNNITIGHMNNSGTFDESTNLGNGVLAAGTSDRWTTTGDHNYSYDLNYYADQTAKYVIEALMLPQVVETENISLDGTEVLGNSETKPYLYIKYTIKNNAETAGEIFEAYYNLATILTKTATAAASNTAFNEGWQNTINITINPDKIDFDANVAQWGDTNNNNLEIK